MLRNCEIHVNIFKYIFKSVFLFSRVTMLVQFPQGCFPVHCDFMCTFWHILVSYTNQKAWVTTTKHRLVTPCMCHLFTVCTLLVWDLLTKESNPSAVCFSIGIQLVLITSVTLLFCVFWSLCKSMFYHMLFCAAHLLVLFSCGYFYVLGVEEARV